MSMKYAVLGLLVQRRGYGYDLVQRFEEQVGPAWQLNAGAIYVALDKLEQEGLVRPIANGAAAPVTRRRTTRGAPRVIYEATPQGVDRFEDWMATGSVDGPDARGAAPQARALPAAQPAAPDRAHLRAGAGVPRAARAAPRERRLRRAARRRPPVVGGRERDGARCRDRPSAGDGRVAAAHPRGDALAAGRPGGAARREADMSLLSLDGVRKRYARGYREVVVLDDVSLDVERGDFVAIWGGQPLRQDDAAARRRGDRGARRRRGRVRRPRPRGALAPRARARLLLDEIGCVVADGAHHARAVGARPRRAAALPRPQPRAGAPRGARRARARGRSRRCRCALARAVRRRAHARRAGARAGARARGCCSPTSRPRTST